MRLSLTLETKKYVYVIYVNYTEIFISRDKTKGFKQVHKELMKMQTALVVMYRVFRKNCMFSQYTATHPSPTLL